MSEKVIAERNVGERFESGSRIITGTELDTLCTISGMRLDPFLSDEAAKALGFRARVVPGAFLLALSFGLLGEYLNAHVHVGTNNMKIFSPLYPYDRVRVEVEVLSKKESSEGDRMFVTWSWALKNQDDVMIAKGENT
jgi:acyl dehydratase